MDDFKGKVAFITGGASGVGLGQAKVLSELGVKVVIADIRRDHLDEALAWFRARTRQAHGIELDITDRAAFDCNVNTNIAEATFTRPEALANTGYEFDAEILTSLRTIYSAGMDPVELAQHLVTAIRENQLYVIPYPQGPYITAGGLTPCWLYCRRRGRTRRG
jgi:NAD(P)-dependent dehydrogenase (short-subunit alcohol dehydrogenase family)